MVVVKWRCKGLEFEIKDKNLKKLFLKYVVKEGKKMGMKGRIEKIVLELDNIHFDNGEVDSFLIIEAQYENGEVLYVIEPVESQSLEEMG